jgi:cysteinyl-tRNA synthetase
MNQLKIYNTLSKKLENFVPNQGNQVKIYICGPTVYDSPHIGHARTYISFDIMKRILADYFNYDVIYTMNITDIDDKIIKRSNERSILCSELTAKYENEFFEEMGKLNVQKPDFVTRVTEYVPEIIKFIEKLEEQGVAYESNGSVYFDLSKYKQSFKYNLLRPETVSEPEENASVDKKDKEDFVLWKASKANEPTYESKWGPGRPGWHIECSAMSSEIFGNKLDIHAGGIDLAFPHHENEIAQCQGHFNEAWVNYFLHTGHLNINGLKMSKSLKNFLTISEILNISSPESLRILFLQHSWNKDMNYDPEQLKEADSIKKKLFNFRSNSESLIKKVSNRSLNTLDKKYLFDLEVSKQAVHDAFINNINTSRALEEILNLITNTNANIKILHSDVLRLILKYVDQILSLFGLINETVQSSQMEEEIASLLCEYRNNVRSAAKSKDVSKLFTLSDKVREDIKKFGFAIDDTPQGSMLRKI